MVVQAPPKKIEGVKSRSEVVNRAPMKQQINRDDGKEQQWPGLAIYVYNKQRSVEVT
jgi:hypothetical protein